MENHCTCYNCSMIDEPTNDIPLENRIEITEAILKGLQTNIKRLDWRLQELEEWAQRTNRKLQ